MLRLSSRCTGPFRIFTLTSLRCLAAGRRGTTAVITSRPCRSSPGSGATPRICRRRFRRQPGGCGGFSPNPPGTTTQSWAAFKSTWDPGLDIRRRCGCSTAATSPSRAGSPWEWPVSTAAGWARWPTARPECSWLMSARWGAPWWTKGFICRRAGPRTTTGVRRRGVRRRGRATGRRRKWRWRCWSGHRSGAI